jgi:hypothetical protein
MVAALISHDVSSSLLYCEHARMTCFTELFRQESVLPTSEVTKIISHVFTQGI